MAAPTTARTARVKARIAHTQVIRLSVADQARFAEVLLTPPAPSEAFDRAVQAHARLIATPAQP